MKIYFRKIKISYYDDLKIHIAENLTKFLNAECDSFNLSDGEKTLDEISEPIYNLNGDYIELDDDFFSPVGKLQYEKDFNIGIKIYRKLNGPVEKSFGEISDKYFWAYFLNIPLVKKYVLNRFFNNNNNDEDDDEESDTNKNLSFNEKLINKIRKVFLADGTISRTGLYFYWNLVYFTYDKKNFFDLAKIAFEFIDPVKAIFERSFRKNKNIVKAFVEGIINNNKSKAFKNKTYRTLIPTHISNVAAINNFFCYDSYYELLKKITSEQRKLILLYEDSELNN